MATGLSPHLLLQRTAASRRYAGRTRRLRQEGTNLGAMNRKCRGCLRCEPGRGRCVDDVLGLFAGRDGNIFVPYSGNYRQGWPQRGSHLARSVAALRGSVGAWCRPSSLGEQNQWVSVPQCRAAPSGNVHLAPRRPGIHGTAGLADAIISCARRAEAHQALCNTPPGARGPHQPLCNDTPSLVGFLGPSASVLRRLRPCLIAAGSKSRGDHSSALPLRAFAGSIDHQSARESWLR